MFTKPQTTKFTESFSDKIQRLSQEIQTADAIIIGGGAGLSASAGFTYDGHRFEKYFGDFQQKYGITDMYSGGFYPYDSLEEYWAWWSRHIYINRYEAPVGKPYSDLLTLVQGRDYFVITTNVDHQFQKAGFDKERLFYTQGDYGLWQCSKACHRKTYDNEQAVRQMIAMQHDLKIPTELIPHCPVCGAPMTMNLRCDDKFVEDEGWHTAANRYCDFIRRHKGSHLLLLELGVGFNTPSIIKYPFWQLTAQNPQACYVCLNLGESICQPEIQERSLCIDADIGRVIGLLAKNLQSIA